VLVPGVNNIVMVARGQKFAKGGMTAIFFASFHSQLEEWMFAKMKRLSHSPLVCF